MDIETSLSHLVDLVVELALDIRIVVVVGLAYLAHWAWKRPRPREDAKGKTVFITGCDSGMGHRMARRFHDLGMHVFAGCLYPDGSGAQELKKICPHRLHVVPLDITRDDQVKQAVIYVKKHLPPGDKGLYCLVNNAGILAYTDFELMTQKMCEEVVGVNVLGTMRVTKHFLPVILQTPGRIVTITSILARLLYPQTSIYCATKHALDGFFSSLRFEVEGKGVHIAAIEPGDFSRTTDILQWTHSRLDEMWQNLTPEEKISKLYLFERTKKRVEWKKCTNSEKERNYEYLLRDLEDAILAENPQWHYVSAPLIARIVLWIIRNLPERWAHWVQSNLNH